MALHDALIGAHASGDIVGLDGQDLLQSVGRAVGLQGPDLHFSESLAAELGLAAQRLLRHQAVGSGGAGVDLVVHQMVELEEVHPADGDVVVELLAGAAVVQNALAVLAESGLLERFADRDLVGSVENGSGDLPSQRLSGVAQMDLQHLPDVHSGRNAQGVEHDVQRRAVGQIRHILAGQDAADDALVAVTSGHLVAHADLSLLCDVYADHLVHTGRHLIAMVAGENLHVHNDAALAVGDLEGGVAHLAGLFTEDGAQQPLLGGQVGLALGRDLADQDISRTHLGAHGDDASLVKILESVLAHAGDVAGDLFGPELGVAGVALVFLHMDGGVHIVHHEALVEQYGVLIVVAFPGGEAHEHVLAQADLALRRGGAVRDDVAFLHALAHLHDGPLVEAGALVGAGEFDKLVILALAAIVADGDIIRAHALDHAVALGKDHDAGVHGAAVLDAGGNDGLLGGHQRYGLTLHVRAHQSAVGVVVLQERDHGGGDGDHHARRHVHVIHAVAVDLDDLVAVAAGDTAVEQAALLVQRLGRHGHDVLILLVGGHVHHFPGDDAGLLVDAAIGRDQEAVLVHAGIGAQVVDQADVGTFGGLNKYGACA